MAEGTRKGMRRSLKFGMLAEVMEGELTRDC